jgi:MFS family permease
MFAQIVPPEQRASVISIRNVLLGITSMLATLLGGKFLEFFPLPLNYQLLFGLAFVASMASFYHLTRLRVPPPPEKTPDAVEPIRAERGYFALFRASSRFTRFALASFVFYWGVNLPLPLYSIYWVKNLGASDAWIGLIAMVGSATTIFAYPIFARLSTRYGTRLLLLAATFGLAGYPLFTALTTSVEPLLLISFYGGIFGPAMQLSFFNGLLEVSPAARRPSYIALYNTLINLAAFAAPLIGTALTGVMDIRLALVIGAVLRVAGGMLFWRLGV